MRRLVGSIALALVMAGALAPAALADGPKWRERTLDCGTAGTKTFLLPPSEYVTAFVPLHEMAGGAVLVPFIVQVGQDTYVSKPQASKSDAMTQCTYIDPEGLHIVITGKLTPNS